MSRFEIQTQRIRIDAPASFVWDVLTDVDFLRRKREGRKSRLLAEILGKHLIAGNGVVESLARRPSDVGPSQVRNAATMGIRRAEVGQVRHHRDIVLMPLERGQPFGQPDLGETSGESRSLERLASLLDSVRSGLGAAMLQRCHVRASLRED